MNGQLALGEALRDEGMARADAAELPDWKARADHAIGYLAEVAWEGFTAADVRRLAGDPDHPNAFGARLVSAARRGLIVKVGYKKSERPSLHAHPIAVWRGVP